MKYKAIDILRTLDSAEFRDCIKFMESPLLNSSPKVAKLFELLSEFYPAYDLSGFTEEKINKVISPHLEFNKSSIKNLFADLAEALEEFLIIRNFSVRTFEKMDILREEYFKRKLWKHFNKVIQKSELMLEKNNRIGTDHFLDKYRLYSDKFNFLSMNKPKNGSEYAKEFREILDERAKNIAGFFTKEMIRQYENLLAMTRTFGDNGNSDFMKRIFEVIDFEELTDFMLKSAGSKSNALIFSLYNAMFRCFSEFEESRNYFRYKDLLLKNIKLLSMDEVRFHLIRLVRYCLSKSEGGVNSEFERELLDVYKYILDNEYYKTGITDYMPVEFFRSIILQALKMKDYDYAEHIIETRKKELHPARRENMELYAKAHMNFHRGYFDDALENCLKTKLDHFVLKFELKDLMLMISYETKAEAGIRSQLDAYRHLLRNDCILSKPEKKKYRNFLNAIACLFSVRNSKRISDCYEIEKMLENEMTNRVWVQEKLKEMKLNHAADNKKRKK